MSAVAAVLRFDEALVDRRSFATVLAAMAARSPDGQTLRFEGGAALGHGMLLNTPEAANERQPLSALDGRMLMVWDGRIDNRVDIQHELGLHGVSPRDDTDPELVLQLFLIFREKTPELLLGDFAFVIYDRVEQSLFCARDHVGARPLHYILSDRLLAVASEDEALIPLLTNGARANVNRLVYARIPILDDFDWSEGWIDGIRSLPPGTWLYADRNRRIRRRLYWRIAPKSDRLRLSGSEAVEAFAGVMERATLDRLRVAGKPAMLLSGGIDSATVAAAAYRRLRDRDSMTAYSVVADAGIECIETDAIRRMLATTGWNGRQVSVPSLASSAEVPDVGQLAWDRPHPVNNSILLIGLLATQAGRDGNRVLLNGVSGDLSFFAPDDYFLEIARTLGWRAALREIRLAGERHVYLRGRSPAAMLTQAAWNHCMPLALKRSRPARRRSARQLAAASGLDPDTIRSLHIVERIQAIWARNDRFLRMSPAEQHCTVLRPPGIVRGLDGYDRVGGRAGVEMRDPLADIRVIEWLQSVAVQTRSFEGRTKWVGREYVRLAFGESVAWRTDKEHLGEYLAVAAMRALASRGDDAGVDTGAVRSAMMNGSVRADDELASDYDATTLKRWQRGLLDPFARPTLL